MKKLFNNKGFTLVEMVVAFAILAVIMLTVTFVIGTSSNTYSKIATDINLQYESQLAMNQLQEYIIDCNACIGVNSGGDTLYVINKTDDSHYEAYKFVKNADTDELYFYNKTIETSDFNPADPGNYAFTDGTGELMSSYVKDFSAAVADSSVIVTMKYGSGSETYNGRQTFALRNQVPNISMP
jgi:prepilin-type N-terminal cleavage/methylation domain-containing protein